MKLVVGLGNPGPDYARTRHNVGYLVADAFARQIGAEFTLRKFQSELAEGRAGSDRVWVMKPQTWMNRSGEAVGPALHFWKAELSDLVRGVQTLERIDEDSKADRFRQVCTGASTRWGPR